MKKKILVISNRSHEDYGTFLIDTLNEYGERDGIEYFSSTFRDISIQINPNSQIKFLIDNIDATTYDMVYFRKVDKSYKDIAIALSHILKKKSIPFIDSLIVKQRGISKVYQSILCSLYGISSPKSFFVSKIKSNISFSDFVKEVGIPFILKDINGTKGVNNFLIHTIEEFNKVTKQSVEFIAQEYIPHNFDYRLLVYNYKTSTVKKRVKTDLNEHRANISVGGKLKSVDITSIDPEIRQLAERAAKIMKRQLVGIDILTSQVTGEHFFIELNNSPAFARDIERFDDIQKLHNFITSGLL